MAQAQVGHEGRGDQHAIAKTMHAVARQDRPAATRCRVVRMGMAVGAVPMVVVGWRLPHSARALVPMHGFGERGHAGVVLMPVVPQLGLVEQKEKDQPAQNRQKQRLRRHTAFKRFGQQM